MRTEDEPVKGARVTIRGIYPRDCWGSGETSTPSDGTFGPIPVDADSICEIWASLGSLKTRPSQFTALSAGNTKQWGNLKLCADSTAEGLADSGTLDHMNGFDFSAGTPPADMDWDVSDGDIIGWVPPPSDYPDGVVFGDGLWWRCYKNTATDNFTKDMGAVTLSSVTSIPVTWDGGKDQPLSYLQQDHVYVVKCRDGYAKFLVKSLDLGASEAEVDFSFTSGTTFSQ